jgi:hypothetical protein
VATKKVGGSTYSLPEYIFPLQKWGREKVV